MKDRRSPAETPPLTRAGRKAAEAKLAAAQFEPTSDGNGAIRQFEVHGMAVTELLRDADVIGAPAAPTKVAVPSGNASGSTPSASETAPLSRQGRKVADAALKAATFKPTVDGKRLVRRFDVHGMVVTEIVDVDAATNEEDGKR